MARSVLIVLTAALPLTAALADPTPIPPPPPPPLAPPAADAMPGRPPAPPEGMWPRKDKGRPPKNEGRHPGKDDDEDGPIKRFKKRLQEMSPAEREHFKENWQRWKGMAEGEKRNWQDRAAAERDRMKKVIDDAMAAAGLKLSNDQKEVFALRYRQERRRVEEELHREFDAKRDEKMKAVIDQLKNEFSTPATPTPAPTP